MTMPATAVVRSSRFSAAHPLGRWLRATSIDELPELFNILRGEMFLLAPGPCFCSIFLCIHQQARRHDVKPGFSGWAQITVVIPSLGKISLISTSGT